MSAAQSNSFLPKARPVVINEFDGSRFRLTAFAAFPERFNLLPADLSELKWFEVFASAPDASVDVEDSFSLFGITRSKMTVFQEIEGIEVRLALLTWSSPHATNVIFKAVNVFLQLIDRVHLKKVWSVMAKGLLEITTKPAGRGFILSLDALESLWRQFKNRIETFTDDVRNGKPEKPSYSLAFLKAFMLSK